MDLRCEERMREALEADERIRWREIVGEVIEELRRSNMEHGPFLSAHEGHSLLREEFEELWDEIKIWKERSGHGNQKARFEAVQVAAMAIKLIMFIDS